MSQARLQQTIQHYRAQLLAREAKAEAALNAAHKHTLALIQPQLDKLYREIQAKQQAGEEIPLSWLYQQKRLEILKRLIAREIDLFAALAQTTTGQLQHVGVQIGQQSAMQQLQSTAPGGISWSFGLPSTKAIADLVGATQKGSPLADLFNGFGAEAADKAGKALITGLTLGQNPRQIAPQVQQALDISRARALTVSRTELLRAYRSSSLLTYQQNADVLTGWVWQSALDARCCAACIAMNGTVHSLDEEMGTHPNCRCSMSPRSKDWSDILGPLGIDTSDIPDSRPDIQSGSDWFNEQDEPTQRSILGAAKYEAFKNGDFELSDIVGRSHDPDWGSSIYEKPLKALVK